MQVGRMSQRSGWTCSDTLAQEEMRRRRLAIAQTPHRAHTVHSSELPIHTHRGHQLHTLHTGEAGHTSTGGGGEPPNLTMLRFLLADRITRLPSEEEPQWCSLSSGSTAHTPIIRRIGGGAGGGAWATSTFMCPRLVGTLITYYVTAEHGAVVARMCGRHGHSYMSSNSMPGLGRHYVII